MGEDEIDAAVTAWFQKPLYLKSLVKFQHHPRYNYFSRFCYSAVGKRLTDLLPLPLPDFPALQTEQPPCTLHPPCSVAIPKILPLPCQAGHPAGYKTLLFIHSLVKGASPLHKLSVSPGGRTTGQVA